MIIDLDQLILALSNTVDLVGVDEVQHSKRVAFMALACAEIMGMGEAETTALFRAGLIHDCGVSSTRIHKKLIDEMDWQDSHIHCEIGAGRLSRFAPLAPMAEVILHHHTRWENLKDRPLPDGVKRHAALIYLLDRVDALAADLPSADRLTGREEIRRKVQDLRGAFFQPELVEVFLAASNTEAFWITMEPAHLPDYLARHQPTGDLIPLPLDELKTVAALFAEVVDAKSRYTAEHSTGVAALSHYLAGKCGLDTASRRMVDVAGLLHDLGKLQVPDDILERKGALEGRDLSVMRHHSYVTLQILQKIQGFEDISLWAADHHEKLDGTGYPFRKTANDLPLESRIVIIADIFQALAQNRPYRRSQSPEAILDFLQRGRARGQLDPELVRIVAAEPDSCYAVAVGR